MKVIHVASNHSHDFEIRVNEAIQTVNHVPDDRIKILYSTSNSHGNIVYSALIIVKY